MGELKVDKIHEDVPRGTFDCGNSSINNLIFQSYFPTLLQRGYAYQVSSGKIVVGYYMIKYKSIGLNYCPAEISQYEDDICKNCCSAHITYIAVRKDVQNQKIGTYILKIIIASILRLCNDCPISLITLDALREKYDWYHHLGFKLLNDEDKKSSSTTVTMYMDCILERDLIDNYTKLV